MKKRTISMIMAAIMLFTLMPVSTFAASYNLGYSVGASEHKVDSSACVEAENASVDSTGVAIAAGGRAVYNFWLPFNSRSVKLLYSGMGNITIQDGETTYNVDLTADGEHTLNFAESLGYTPEHVGRIGVSEYEVREFVMRRGERNLVISSSADIKIKELIFEKEKTPVPDASFILPDVSDEVFKTMSTVIMDLNSPIIVVNGGRRYIDVNDTSAVPYNNNGTIYLPIDTLAKALGYYYEDVPSKGYAMLRSETHEAVLMGSSCTLQTGLGEREDAPEAIIYRDGKTFAAVRYFAELAGETVGFKDGLVVIDNKFVVEEVLSTSLFNYAKEKFSDYRNGATVIGKTYYVSQEANASDTNNGSALAPFRTLNKAGEIAKAGDTVIIREGVYRETFAPKNDGNALNPIKFCAAEGEKVVISAADELGTFAHFKDDIYVTPMTWDLGDGKNQLFINGEVLTEARYPNGPNLRGDYGEMDNLWPIRGDLYKPSENNMVIRSDTLLNQADNYWKGASYVGMSGRGYALETARVESSTYGELKMTDTSTHWWWTHAAYGKWNFGYLSGHINALDIPGEWVRQNDTLYMIFPENTEPSSVKVEAKKRQLVIDIADRKYVQLEGITTVGGGVRMNNSEMCMLNNMDMKYISHYTHSSDQRDGYIDFPTNKKDTNGAPQRGEVGIFIGGTDNFVVNSKIDHSAAAGIYGVGLYTYIDNNILNDCGYMGSYVSGITFDTLGTESRTAPRGGHSIYNNTVYNCGRSCLNVSMNDALGNNIMTPYLPMEIAYNDFHDGILASLDTGLVYEYYTQLGYDEQMTKLHHNYIYITSSLVDSNPFSLGIYHDGGTHGTDTYNNVCFTTQEDVVFTNSGIYQQALKLAAAYHTMYGNLEHGYVEGGVDGLTNNHFPQGKYFYAGSKQGVEDYLENYDAINSGADGLQYLSKNAELSSGVTLEDGYAVFSGNEQYICYENVDFGEKSNILRMAVKGDRYHSADIMEVTVGSSIDSGIKSTVNVQINASTLNTPETLDVPINDASGVNNVYIKMKDYRSVSMAGISVDRKREEANADQYSAKVYGGNFTSYDYSDAPGAGALKPVAEASVDGDNVNPMVNNTWAGSVFEYKDIDFKCDTDVFVLAAASGAGYEGQPLEIYIDSLSSEPIIKCYVNKTSFFDYTPVYLPLDKPVTAGNHDVYIKFTREAGDNKTSNLYYFGFPRPDAQIDDWNPSVLAYVSGGAYDAELSAPDSKMPFVSRYVKRPNYSANGLTNTRAGSMAAYTDVEIYDTANNFTVSYSTDAGYDGQTVEVRVGSPASEPVAQFVTEGNGWENFNEVTVKLNKPIEAGKHNIYLTFGGDKGGVQTSRIYGFWLKK